MSARAVSEIRIDQRFMGVPGVTLGGYIAGLTARRLGSSVVVTLKAAVPAGATARIESNGTTANLQVNGAIAASAAEESFPSTAPKPIDTVTAATASQRYLGFRRHFFPHCFTCGPANAEGEGLRIFPGAVDGSPLVGCLFTPPPLSIGAGDAVADEYLWAALDCPAIWGSVVHGENAREDRAVTGRLALKRYAPVSARGPHIILGWPLERDGRKVIAGAAIYSLEGELLVESRQTLVLTNHGVPLHSEAWAAESV